VCEILERESDIEVLGLRALAGDALAHIESFDPDVVVIAEEDPSDADAVAQILRIRPNLLLVRVDLEEKAFRVHRSTQVAATRAGLLEAIRGTAGRDAPSLEPACGQVTTGGQKRLDRIGRRSSSVRRQQKE
jgi:chemotaxis response regulator CheB